MSAAIPASHLDLLTGRVYAVISTLQPDGQPQSSMVWIGYDGQHLLVSTTADRRKTRNAQERPRVSLFAIDPDDDGRWISVRGAVVEITQEGAEALADQFTQRYSQGKRQRFYGDVYPEEHRHQETRVVIKIAPVKVSVDAIFR